MKPQTEFVDAKLISEHYILNVTELDSVFHSVQTKILEEFTALRLRVLTTLSHLNYIAYLRANPGDDISFLFRETVHASTVKGDLDRKETILKRMMDFGPHNYAQNQATFMIQAELKDLLQGQTHDKAWFTTKFIQQCPVLNRLLSVNASILNKHYQNWKEHYLNKESGDLFLNPSPNFPANMLRRVPRLFLSRNRRLSAVRLLFRASEHQFSASAFKEKCAGKGPTLLIARSNDHYFGGFTPCKWLKSTEKDFVADPEGESFLFSLSKELVFPIKKNQTNYAVSAYGSWGPIFGSPYGPDLSIADKCNLKETSGSNLGSHYELPEQVQEYSQAAYSLLAGAKRFKITDYELYEVRISQLS